MKTKQIASTVGRRDWGFNNAGVTALRAMWSGLWGAVFHNWVVLSDLILHFVAICAAHDSGLGLPQHWFPDADSSWRFCLLTLTPSIIFGTTLGRHYTRGEMTTLPLATILSFLDSCSHLPWSAMGYSFKKDALPPVLLIWQGLPCHSKACKVLHKAPSLTSCALICLHPCPGPQAPSTLATLASSLECPRPIPSSCISTWLTYSDDHV